MMNRSVAGEGKFTTGRLWVVVELRADRRTILVAGGSNASAARRRILSLNRKPD